MTLSSAVPIDGRPLPLLRGTSPYPCATLQAWRGRKFLLPSQISHAAPANLRGLARSWAEDPEWQAGAGLAQKAR